MNSFSEVTESRRCSDSRATQPLAIRHPARVSTLALFGSKPGIKHSSAYEEMRRRIEGAELRYDDTAAHIICDGYATQCVEDPLDFLQRRG